MPTRKISLPSGLRTFDARPDRLDLRDRPYLPPVKSLPARYPSDQNLKKFLPKYIQHKLVLDQGKEGACTGFGLAATINYMLWWRSLETKGRYDFSCVSPYMLYDLARFYDEWPGENYDGSSCRGAMKGWHKHGVCEYSHWTRSVKPLADKKRFKPKPAWAEDAAKRPIGVYYRVDRQSVTDMQAAINEMGAVYVSADVHSGWDAANLVTSDRLKSHDDLPHIPYAKDIAPSGGHAFALVGYNEWGFVVQNSWGPDWGKQGFAVMSYADWVKHGRDAWVCSLGVPQAVPGASASPGAASAKRGVSPVRQLGTSLVSPAEPIKSTAPPAAEPWNPEDTYAHTLVAGNDGIVRLNQPDVGSAADQVEQIVVTAPAAWAKANKTNAAKPLKLMLYAHGGLNAEENSLKRISKLGPYFQANGIYPVFYTWRTGFLETLGSALGDAFTPSETPATGRIADAKDALLEGLCHGLRFIWGEMKENAARGADPGHAIDLMADALVTLAGKVSALEIHLVGHSAGSFVHGHLMDALAKWKLPIHSLTLYAPACSLDFAAEHFMPAVQKKRLAKDAFWLHVLSDKRERDDFVGPGSVPVYGKSLLYLVSRGFESRRKTPLAGLEHCLDPRADNPDDDLWTPGEYSQVAAWREFVNKLPAQADGRAAAEITTASAVPVKVNSDGSITSIDSSHGAFDNDLDVITRSIKRILGMAQGDALPVPVNDLKEL